MGEIFSLSLETKISDSCIFVGPRGDPVEQSAREDEVLLSHTGILAHRTGSIQVVGKVTRKNKREMFDVDKFGILVLVLDLI